MTWLTSEALDEYDYTACELVAGERYDDDPNERYKFVYVNLLKVPEKAVWIVTVYDCDFGGPIDYWVNDAYDNLDEAMDIYKGRCEETAEGTPHYVCNVCGGCDWLHSPVTKAN